MTYIVLALLLTMAGPAHAQASGDFASTFTQLIPLILIFVIFWLFLIRPQMKKQKAHQQKVSSVQKGDNVLLSSGVYGKVTKLLDNNRVEVEIAPSIAVKVAKAMLADVISDTPNPQPKLANNLLSNKTKK